MRRIVGEMPFLVPGVGAQGGDVGQVVRNGQTAAGEGLMVSSSRGILYASSAEDFEAAARSATLALRDQINRHRLRRALGGVDPQRARSVLAICSLLALAVLSGCSRSHTTSSSGGAAPARRSSCAVSAPT